MNRVSSLANHTLSQAQIAATQKRMQELQIQLSTGYKAMRYSGIASETPRLISLENTRMRTDGYISNNKTIVNRLQVMELNVAKTFDVATELRTLLTNALNGSNAADLPLSTMADNMMSEVARLLNGKIGDRYLFSGTASLTAPIDYSAAGFVAPPDTYPSNADTGYYEGDSTLITTRIADDSDIAWGATADEPGFEQLIRALHLTKTASTTPTIDTLRLEEALAVVNQAIENIPNIRARVASAQKSIERANDAHADLTVYIDESITDIKAVDIPLTMTRLTSDQMVLEASYSTIARLSQLSLVAYLN